jgi:hypothetical protein
MSGCMRPQAESGSSRRRCRGRQQADALAPTVVLQPIQPVVVQQPIVQPPPQPQPQPVHLWVRVLLYQDQNHPIPQVNITVDGNRRGPTDNQGLVDCGQMQRGNHTITVPLPPSNAPFPECQCGVCRAQGATPIRYRAWQQVEYQAANIQNDRLQNNPVDVFVDECVRIRLGWPLNVAQRAWLRLYLPTAVGSGGQGMGQCMWLEVRRAAGSLEYYGDSPTNAVLNTFNQDGSIWYGNQAGAWHYFHLLGGAGQVTINLTEQGFSRETAGFDSDAVIPWNFYFWSCSRLMAPNAATPVTFLEPNDVSNASLRSPFRTFDNYFGLGTDSFDWETDPTNSGHNDLALGAHGANPKTWEGHCNWMCAASVIFEPPQDFDPFDFEELKVFAAEFAANNTQSASVWAIEDRVSQLGNAQQQAVQNLLLANSVDKYPLALLDAGLNLNLPPLMQQRSNADAPAIRPALAKLAGTFFQEMQDHIGVQGHLLFCDLRSGYDPTTVTGQQPAAVAALKVISAKAAEVWNQAVFYYQAQYLEHADSLQQAGEQRQAQDLHVYLTFYANSDGVLPTDHVPATYQGGDVVLTQNNWSRQARVRLQFTNGGNLDADDALNNWEACTDPAGQAHYFLPRTIDRIVAVRNQPVNGGGNPYVTRARVEALGLQFRNING